MRLLHQSHAILTLPHSHHHRLPPSLSTQPSQRSNMRWFRTAATSAATAAVIATTGDVLMQMQEQRWRGERGGPDAVAPPPIDTARTARLIAYRVFQAPILETAWRTMDATLPGKGAVHVLCMVAADQLLLLPPWTVIFYYSQARMEQRDHAEGVRRVREKFVPTLRVGVPFYVLVHLVTFGVMPVHLRIAWVSTCGVAWNAFLSWSNQDSRGQVGAWAAGSETAQSHR